jgi:hypothetical protein
MKSTAERGKTRTGPHRSAWNGKGGISPQTAPATKPIIPARPATLESDQAVRAMYPVIGDSVQVDADIVPRGQRRDRHQFAIDHGIHGKFGTVNGTRVDGGVYELLIEAPTFSVWIPADIVRHAEPPPQPDVMPASRISPERMKKRKDGSYNQT